MSRGTAVTAARVLVPVPMHLRLRRVPAKPPRPAPPAAPVLSRRAAASPVAVTPRHGLQVLRPRCAPGQLSLLLHPAGGS